MTKPLGHRAYGSIPHLPDSRRGPGDHGVNDGQARICAVHARPDDRIWVTEKLDGSCVAVANIDGQITPLIRAGYPAISSKYEQHRMFHHWVMERVKSFEYILLPGERICGEWLAKVHGNRYHVDADTVFAPFDIMSGQERLPYEQFLTRLELIEWRLRPPYCCHVGRGVTVKQAFDMVCACNRALRNGSKRYCIDEPEGVVYRVEHKGVFDFMAKWVRLDKVDGHLMNSDIWNWRLCSRSGI